MFVRDRDSALGDRGLSLRAGPGSAELHPLLQYLDLLVGELALGWHAEVALVPYGLDEQALVRLAGHEGGAEVAARENLDAARELQIALWLHLAVAGSTLLEQERSHFLLKELDVDGRRFRRQAEGSPWPGEQQR